MRDHQQRHALGRERFDHAQRFADPFQLQLQLQLQRGGDLIAQQLGWLHRLGACDRDALLAAEELIGHCVEPLSQAAALQPPRGPPGG